MHPRSIRMQALIAAPGPPEPLGRGLGRGATGALSAAAATTPSGISLPFIVRVLALRGLVGRQHEVR